MEAALAESDAFLEYFYPLLEEARKNSFLYDVPLLERRAMNEIEYRKKLRECKTDSEAEKLRKTQIAMNRKLAIDGDWARQSTRSRQTRRLGVKEANRLEFESTVDREVQIRLFYEKVQQVKSERCKIYNELRIQQLRLSRLAKTQQEEECFRLKQQIQTVNEQNIELTEQKLKPLFQLLEKL